MVGLLCSGDVVGGSWERTAGGSGVVARLAVRVRSAAEAAESVGRGEVIGVPGWVTGLVSVIGSCAGLLWSVAWSRVTVKSLGRAVEVEVSVGGSMGCSGCS